MKYTLLDMTQSILSSMSADEVNSIGDTPESLQVAEIIRQKYFDIITRVKLPEHEQLVQLQSSADTDSPVLMFVPDGVANLTWLKYFDTDTSVDTNNDNEHDINTDIDSAVASSVPPPGYKYIHILPVREFIEIVNSFNTTETDVDSFTFTDSAHGYPGTYTFYYKTQQTPTYCCIINNYYVIFDSYDSAVDDTLQTNKTMAWGLVTPTFRMEDTFIPDLSEEQFPLLLNEAKSLAFFELKQQPHQLAMQETKRGWSNVQKNKAIVNRPGYFNELPDFGRGTRGGYGAAQSYFKQRGFDR